VQGRGKAFVYAIGNDTEVGQVNALASQIDVGHGTLNLEISRVVKAITLVAFLMGLAVFFLSYGMLKLDWIEAFLYALAIVTANIPEGLLPTVNLSLALGAQRMAKHNALIRGLASVETLSSATVICTDKTGTLTQNQLMVREIWTPDNLVEITGEGYRREGTFKIANEATRRGVEKLLVSAVICNDASLAFVPEKDEFAISGSPTEGALLIAAEKFGYSLAELRDQFAVYARRPFNSDKKKMSVLAKNISNPSYDSDARYLFVKGAPNVIIPDCGAQYKGSHVIPLSESEKDTMMLKNDEFANDGYRILAFAYKKIETDGEPEENDMVFLGLTATYDPPRKEVRKAIVSCRAAGLRITIITGDYGLTAAAIARQEGIIEENDYRIVKGPDLDAMSDKELDDILRTDTPLIFSRATPQNKLRIVEGYKKVGEIVAVTGDGVNDVLALRAANMGIAMGKNGTDVAREAADMILLDDDFSTIVLAIEEGRGIYANIKKFITYILTSNVPELAPMLFAIFMGIPPALTVLQILSIDLGTDLAPALALGTEEPDPQVLLEKPRSKSDRLIDRRLLLRSYAYLGVVESLLAMGAFFYAWMHRFGLSIAQLQASATALASGALEASDPLMQAYRYATTLTLASVVFSQIGNLFACRSDLEPFHRTLKRKNPFIYLGIVVELAIIALIVYVPFLNGVFFTAPLWWDDVLALLICPLVVIGFDYLWKWAFRRKDLAKATSHR
jgi:magnesium-transporting ATPase (P-type)